MYNQGRTKLLNRRIVPFLRNNGSRATAPFSTGVHLPGQSQPYSFNSWYSSAPVLTNQEPKTLFQKNNNASHKLKSSEGVA